MIGEVRTQRDVLRRVGLITLASVSASLLVTALVCGYLLGPHLDGTIKGADLVTMALAISFAVPALVCPPISYMVTTKVRELSLAREALDRLSQTDQLSGLLNRRGFDQVASIALAAAAARQLPVTALMFDLDCLKAINDEFGHEAGDAAIVTACDALRKAAGTRSAIVGREGGDEFAVILPGADLEEALAFAENVRAFLATKPIVSNGQTLQISASVGAAFSTCGGSLVALMSQADSALIHAKRSGRDRVEISIADEQSPLAA